MSDGTAIEWTDATWNVVNGCSVLSPGCTNCYAMKLAGTRLKHHPSRAGLTVDTKAGPVWTGVARLYEPALTQPLKWQRPRKIFVCAHGDLFHETVSDADLDRVFAVMALAPQHIYQVLTKRPERMRAYIRAKQAASPEWVMLPEVGGKVLLPYEGGVPTYIWLGVSVEDQKRADERIPVLLDTPATVRWLSCEPLLGPVDLESAWHGETALDAECWGDCGWCDAGYPPLHNCQKGRQEGGGWVEHPKGRSGLDWIVVGGESGPGARPMHPDWARSLRDQCAAAGVPFLFKQWGDWVEVDPAEDAAVVQRTLGGASFHRFPKNRNGRFLDGVQHDGYPA